ncbi:class I SAM-dependent methyltransferase [Flavimaricola marinus]|uniref:Methyltransferase domain protein n=1 Tax=Flavimaricola marinus TaxID=1819565 RepID=A0A238LEJ8_9RHOB|nr:class I SAM-dependent methyltransferase [Flavimaricola marinus]SMY07983.1 Methyltransferase domain protein [Flavimaricola marinus]
MSAFFTLHSALPREGPGLPEDVAWAAEVAGVAVDARICDAACGPGADVAALLLAAPEGHVTAVDRHAPFVEVVAETWEGDRRVSPVVGDLARIGGPYDFIWCAGALYFLGLEAGLRLWREEALAPGGAVAFSYPCYLTEDPSPEAVAFWEGEGDIPTVSEIARATEAAGFELSASRVVSDAAWEAYYTPMEARIAQLEPAAEPELAKVLQEARQEAASWREVRDQSGYLLCVAVPA